MLLLRYFNGKKINIRCLRNVFQSQSVRIEKLFSVERLIGFECRVGDAAVNDLPWNLGLCFPNDQSSELFYQFQSSHSIYCGFTVDKQLSPASHISICFPSLPCHLGRLQKITAVFLFCTLDNLCVHGCRQFSSACLTLQACRLRALLFPIEIVMLCWVTRTKNTNQGRDSSRFFPPKRFSDYRLSFRYKFSFSSNLCRVFVISLGFQSEKRAFFLWKKHELGWDLTTILLSERGLWDVSWGGTAFSLPKKGWTRNLK